MEEVYCGYLWKSPPSAKIRYTSSWKHRFFVLGRTEDGNYELKYYRTIERDRPLNSIFISNISVLSANPEANATLQWIQRNFRCSSSLVLFMKVEDPAQKIQREYFFIAKTREEVERWFNALNGLMKMKENRSDTTQPPKRNSEDLTSPSATEEKPNDLKPNTFETKPCLSQTEENVEAKEDDEEPLEDASQASRQSQAGTEDSLLDCVSKALNIQATHQTSDSKEKNTQELSEERGAFEIDIYPSHSELEALTLLEQDGKLCVSECSVMESSGLFHKGDQILAFNDLITDTVEDLQTFLRKLRKDKVKLTILRFPGSDPLLSEAM